MSGDSCFSVSVESISAFLEDLGTFVVDCVEELEAEELQSLLLDLSRIVLKLICSIGSICAERDLRNEYGANLNGVLTYELVRLRGWDFRIIVHTHHDRLLTRWSSSEIDHIEQ